jgi:hypothetical protein
LASDLPQGMPRRWSVGFIIVSLFFDYIRKMLKRLHNSFAFRFPILFYKNWLVLKRPPAPRDKPIASFNYAVLCGRTHFPFLKQGLLSIQKQFKKLPFVYICVSRFWFSGKTDK